MQLREKIFLGLFGLFGGSGGMHGAIHVRKIYCMERPVDRFSPTADAKRMRTSFIRT